MLIDQIKNVVRNTLVKSLSTYVINNLASAKASGQLNVDENQLNQVITIVKTSVDASYALVEKTMSRELEAKIAECKG